MVKEGVNQALTWVNSLISGGSAVTILICAYIAFKVASKVIKIVVSIIAFIGLIVLAYNMGWLQMLAERFL
jgi:hypothetical protein